MTAPFKPAEVMIPPTSAGLVVHADGSVDLFIPLEDLDKPTFASFFLSAVAYRMEDEEWKDSMIDWMNERIEEQRKKNKKEGMH